VNKQAQVFWERSQAKLRVAKLLVNVEPDSAASAAYYAAFSAVLAYFADANREFRRHTAVEAALHHELVKTGKVPGSVGGIYSSLLKTRIAADYGIDEALSAEEAAKAVSGAETVVEAIAKLRPDFPMPPE
jgi:uncharacterized protein (UPF0332 family)